MADAGRVESPDAEAEAKRRRLFAEEANKGDGSCGNSKANNEAGRQSSTKIRALGSTLMVFFLCKANNN